MTGFTVSETKTVQDLGVAGREIARSIWNHASVLDELPDPRDRTFANAVIDELAQSLATTPGVIQNVMKGAASAAEDLNVDPFQGIIEVIQNADDLFASEVRFAFRQRSQGTQLLIVHDGSPVTYAHVLAMTLPFLTTKAGDATQKGRFGIGLKTLARISSGIAVHSNPYHFRAERLAISRIEPESALPGFYDGLSDTMLVLDLDIGFNVDSLREWFESWNDDGLLFLNSVRTFRWCDIAGGTLLLKSLTAEPWRPLAVDAPTPNSVTLLQRNILSSTNSWRVYAAEIQVPLKLSRAHKATGKTTCISIAVPAKTAVGGLYIAFKTRIPNSLQISIDAQFDPSTAREELIDNAWNRWLIERCADVIGLVATTVLKESPRAAWRAIPLSSERIGHIHDRWPCKEFATAFLRIKTELALHASLKLGEMLIPLAQTAYEDAYLGRLLATDDVESLAPGRKAIIHGVRDIRGRWRQVLGELNASKIVGTKELLSGFATGKFSTKSVQWCVEAAAKIATSNYSFALFNTPCLRATDGRFISCQPSGRTNRPLVFATTVSRFSFRWQLLDQLHAAYGDSEAGKQVCDWLAKHAAYSVDPNPAVELAAFAEKFADAPVELSESELRDLRDRFDGMSDRVASPLGLRVGTAILLNGITYIKGKKHPRKISPCAAYLPKSLDEHAEWPEAAADLPGITWLSAAYDEQLKASTSGASRRREDGKLSRGARRFLSLLGAEVSPRTVKNDNFTSNRPTRLKELQKAGANRVEYDYSSPDLERVLSALPGMSRRERRVRSLALVRMLSRHWDRVYNPVKSVPAQELKRTLLYSKGSVSSDWLCVLRDTEWVTVGGGELRTPDAAVVRNAQTETLYESNSFLSEATGLSRDFTNAVGLVTDVRASDLVVRLEQLKNGAQLSAGTLGINQIYRALSKLCPEIAFFNGSVGDLTVGELRRRFADSGGLICVQAGQWGPPSSFLTGRDVLHKPELFVPSSSAYSRLWQTLEIRPPTLAHAESACRELALRKHSVETEAALIDLYRYIETLLPDADRIGKKGLARLPVVCADQWISSRPIYLVEAKEIREQLSKRFPKFNFWTPPCEVRELGELTLSLGIQTLAPTVKVTENRRPAGEQGELLRTRFQAAVEHLSVGLAKNDPQTREQLRISWDELRDIPLFVYQDPFTVEAVEPAILKGTIPIRLTALMVEAPQELHVWEDALQLRESGGRAIASLFPTAVQRSIQAEWVASWMDSLERPIRHMRFAADEERKEKIIEAAGELAETIQVSVTSKISVSPPASRHPDAKARRLKEFQAGVSTVTIHEGTNRPGLSSSTARSLATQPATTPSSSGTSRPAKMEYSTIDLEQRGWEILTHALSIGNGPALNDFRRRRGVGADGAINWKTFVELKTSGRSMPTSVQMTNPEYERALEQGHDYILALVYGLEEGEHTEVRLIFDPARTTTVKPINGVKLSGLADAPAVILSLGDLKK